MAAHQGSIRYWLALTRIRWLHRASVFKLLERHGGPEAVFNKLSIEGPPAVLRALRGFSDWAWVERELKLAGGKGVRLITYDHEEYPLLLKEIPDPPYLLYARGKVLTPGRTVAVEGTRNPTPKGVETAEHIARSLAKAGFIVVSGMARGCDTGVHKGALSVRGFTVAVLGTGVDIPYPAGNIPLYEEIVREGLVISEFPMGTPPEPGNFLRRNRIISGISSGIVVVEASLRSGSLMTARLAIESGRKVFVLRGMRGPAIDRLLEKGAIPIDDAADVADVVRAMTP